MMSNPRGHPPQAALENAATLDGTSANIAPPLRDTLAAAASQPTSPDAAVVSIADDKEPAMPARIGRYMVLRRLGQGGMGVVYSAYDADLDRKVAIKVVRHTLQNSSLGRTRVQQEAQAMARVAHPNVVHVYEVGQDSAAESRPVFIAMEFVPGGSLAEWQRQRRETASLDELMRLYLEAASGLAAAHACGLIHRDFKPDNVLVGADGRARVVDFGLARALDAPREAPLPSENQPRRSGSGARLTEAGAILGTPGYMAPEQVLGNEADARSDQFSFCVALYEALYQQLPFAGDSFEDFSVNVVDGKLRPPPRNRPGGLEIPILLEEALRRGLSRDPAARFPSMEALIAALSRGIRPDSDSQRSRRRKRLALLVGCGGILLMIVGRMVTLPKVAHPDLRPSVIMGWITLFISMGFILLQRRQIKRQVLLRRGAYFFFLLAAYMAIGRTIGFAMKTEPFYFHTIELLSMAGLCAVEIPHVGRQYLWPVAVALLGTAMEIVLPAYAPLHTSICYLILAFLVAYLRPWTMKSASATSSPEN